LTITAREKADWSYKSESRIIGFDPRTVEKSMARRPYEAAQSKKMMKRSKVIKKRQERSIEELITNYQPTMIFVEHDSAFVRNISSRTV